VEVKHIGGGPNAIGIVAVQLTSRKVPMRMPATMALDRQDILEKWEQVHIFSVVYEATLLGSTAG